MRLAPGDCLGPYKILSAIGAGGIGEVYRASDSRAGRAVALKIITGECGPVEQEVRAAGALNHPNLLAVYDVGEYEGTPYLAAELLEGETLRSRLKSGALEPRLAMEYALGIAQGLAAAHAAGIVHRDLKPENIFLTRAGGVKILDFGLAKAEAAMAAYMSPEQVRGAAIDARSDIFSFGAVFYEMLAGVRAFERGSTVESRNAILKQDPPDLPAQVPPGLRRIACHCLEKNPELRFQSAADLAFVLQPPDGSDSSATPPVDAGRKPSRRTILAAGTGAAAAAGAFYLGKRYGRVSEPAFDRLTFRRGIVNSARFAPDGQGIVYAAAWEGAPSQIFTARQHNPEARALDIPPARLLSISRSGELAVLLERGSTLARVPLAGGAPREVLRNIEWADWSPDGSSLMIVRQMGPKQQIEFPAGTVWYQSDNFIGCARVSPDGARIAFFEFGARLDVSLHVIERAKPRRTLVAHWAGGYGIVWAPDGKKIWFSGSDGAGPPAIYVVAPGGSPRLVLRQTLAAELQDLNAAGRMLFTGVKARAEMMCQAPGATAERDLSWLDFSTASDISPDGSAVLFYEPHEAALVTGRRAVVYVRKTDGSPAVALGEGRSMGLSPHAQWATAIADGKLLILPTGPGEQRVLQSDTFRYAGAQWFPDGKRLLVWGTEPGRLHRHYVQDASGGKMQPITSEGSSERAAISPDGTIVAAHSGPGVFLFPVDGSEPQPARGAVPDSQPVAWSADAPSLFLRRGSVVDLLDLRTGKSELWKDFQPADPSGVDAIDNISITPDGSAYVYSYGRTQSDLYLADLGRQM